MTKRADGEIPRCAQNDKSRFSAPSAAPREAAAGIAGLGVKCYPVGMERRGSRVFLSLGSNLGDRCGHLRQALELIGELDDTRVLAVSQGYETEPWGVSGQPVFINIAAEIETALEPLELLNAAKSIERRLGRLAGSKWGPREVDIDVVLWDGLESNGPELVIPHPEFRRRAFVMAPLAEIAGDVRDPVSGATVAELASRPEVEGRVLGVVSLDSC